MLRVLLFAVPLAGFVAVLALYAPSLPERMASSFGADGHARDSMSARGFVTFFVVLVVAMTALFAGLAVGLSRIPDALINLPHKEYWLAPDRRAATFARVATFFAIMACAMLTMFDVLFVATVHANRVSPPRMPPWIFWPTFGAFLATVIVALVWFVLGFRKPRSSS